MPIHIDELPCGGGLIGLCAEPRGDEIAEVAQWRPDTVLSLVEDGTTLAAGFAQAGIRWLHLPIPDYGVPDRHGSARWDREIAPVLHDVLSGGGRLLIHCRAGCGRTGMIVLRLMIERGEVVGEALPRLRQARPCAVETAAQLNWAAGAAR